MPKNELLVIVCGKTVQLTTSGSNFVLGEEFHVGMSTSLDACSAMLGRGACNFDCSLCISLALV